MDAFGDRHVEATSGPCSHVMPGLPKDAAKPVSQLLFDDGKPDSRSGPAGAGRLFLARCSHRCSQTRSYWLVMSIRESIAGVAEWQTQRT